MELILWRHAEAEDGSPDMERALTAKGRKQAARMAEWLDRALPQHCRILVSPALRALQTAQALDRKFKTLPALAPDSGAVQVLKACHWPDSREPVLVVGHQPTLGRIAALLIAGSEQDWTLRKANICWITQKKDEQASAPSLRAILGPDLA